MKRTFLRDCKKPGWQQCYYIINNALTHLPRTYSWLYAFTCTWLWIKTSRRCERDPLKYLWDRHKQRDISALLYFSKIRSYICEKKSQLLVHISMWYVLRWSVGVKRRPTINQLWKMTRHKYAFGYKKNYTQKHVRLCIPITWWTQNNSLKCIIHI